jgi:mono/diheme cytochrome c family protein
MKRTSKRQRCEALQRQKQRQRLVLGAIIVGIGLVLIGGFTLLSDGSATLANSFDRQTIALGEQVYAANCAGCHGVNLEGQPDWQQSNPDGSLQAPPHDETGHTWHHGDAALIESIRRGGARLSASMGTSTMPAYKDILDDDEITAVLTYIKSTWPDDIRTAQSSR